MASLKGYFSDRVSRSVKWPFDGGGPGQAPRRRYDVHVLSTSGDVLSCTVRSEDMDRQGQIVSRPTDRGSAKIPLKGLADPAEALELVARAVDPGYFANYPKQVRVQTGKIAGDGIERRLALLETEEGRATGEPAPLPASCDKFRAYWILCKDIALPELFSSKDGTVRARWTDNHKHTLTINYPLAGPLKWSYMMPRAGGYGMRTLRGVCPEEQDIIPFAQMMGLNCTVKN